MSHDLEDFIASSRERAYSKSLPEPRLNSANLGEATRKLLGNERFLDALPDIFGAAISKLRVSIIIERLRKMGEL